MTGNPFARQAPQTAFGFTSPTLIYDRMRTLDREADALNQDVLGNVAEGPFKAGWRAWHAQWKAFFAKTMDEKVGNLLHTDALDAVVTQRRAEFEGFRRDYPNQRRPDGSPVPPSSVPAPGSLATVPKGAGPSILPWWAWLGLGVATVGVGYLGYLKYRELTAKRKAIEEGVLPTIFGGYLGARTGGALAKAAAARDPAKDPLKLDYYADPQNMPSRELVYRPYEHPHLVSPYERARDEPRGLDAFDPRPRTSLYSRRDRMFEPVDFDDEED